MLIKGCLSKGFGAKFLLARATNKEFLPFFK